MLRVTLLLLLSNVFMTVAWYAHLRHMNRSLWLVIFLSWGVAFFEYCLHVPANRLGYAAGISAAQLKTIQEILTLLVFVAFATLYLKEPLRWNTLLGFAFIGIGALFVFAPWLRTDPPSP